MVVEANIISLPLSRNAEAKPKLIFSIKFNFSIQFKTNNF